MVDAAVEGRDGCDGSLRVEYDRDGGAREGEACERSEPGGAVVVMAGL